MGAQLRARGREPDAPGRGRASSGTTRRRARALEQRRRRRTDTRRRRRFRCGGGLRGRAAEPRPATGDVGRFDGTDLVLAEDRSKRWQVAIPRGGTADEDVEDFYGEEEEDEDDGRGGGESKAGAPKGWGAALGVVTAAAKFKTNLAKSKAAGKAVEFAAGDCVEFRDREGSWRVATVTEVGRGADGKPSYTIVEGATGAPSKTKPAGWGSALSTVRAAVTFKNLLNRGGGGGGGGRGGGGGAPPAGGVFLRAQRPAGTLTLPLRRGCRAGAALPRAAGPAAQAGRHARARAACSAGPSCWTRCGTWPTPPDLARLRRELQVELGLLPRASSRKFSPPRRRRGRGRGDSERQRRRRARQQLLRWQHQRQQQQQQQQQQQLVAGGGAATAAAMPRPRGRWAPRSGGFCSAVATAAPRGPAAGERRETGRGLRRHARCRGP